MLGSVIEFLRWCEINLRWQRQREIQRAQLEGAEVEFDPPDDYKTTWYRNHLIEAAENRFDVRIAQGVRYAGLVDFITALEWCAMEFRVRLTRKPRASH